MSTTTTKTYPLQVRQIIIGNDKDNHYLVLDALGNFYAKTYSSYDANLIATAPELLEALKNAVSRMERMDARLLELSGYKKECQLMEIVQARNAISKVEGRTV